VRKIGEKVKLKLFGYISDEDLAALYGGSRVMVYPSLYEGFGLPILEAMSCGCPVICTRTSSLPEVAGNAALFVDPYNPQDLADAIATVVDDITIRRDLIERGFRQAAKFSWEKTAVETLKVFRSLL
jgi:alpha-1,3-rhamnosyl/mannosyltransferase